MTLNLLVPTPYGELALTSVSLVADEKKRREALGERVFSEHDRCSFSGKLTVDGRDYTASMTFIRQAEEFVASGRWELLRFDDDTSPLPEISNIGLRTWRPEHVRKPLEITPEIERALAFDVLSKLAFTVAYHELRAILVTPNWQRWIELNEQVSDGIDEYHAQLPGRLAR